jgi:uncharacterized protein (DUF2147 family)
MKAKFLFIALLLVAFFTPDLFAQNADDILGYWLTQDGDSQVKIFKAKNGKYYGNIKWLETPTREDGSIKLDDKNPDPKMAKKTIMNLQLLKGFEYNEKDSEWINGTIYDPKSGKTYKCFMWFEDGDDVTLHVKGFIGFSLIGSKVEWKREEKLRE